MGFEARIANKLNIPMGEAAFSNRIFRLYYFLLPQWGSVVIQNPSVDNFEN